MNTSHNSYTMLWNEKQYTQTCISHISFLHTTDTKMSCYLNSSRNTVYVTKSGKNYFCYLIFVSTVMWAKLSTFYVIYYMMCNVTQQSYRCDRRDYSIGQWFTLLFKKCSRNMFQKVKKCIKCTKNLKWRNTVLLRIRPRAYQVSLQKMLHHGQVN